ncbi:probable myosin-binding protein 5 [Mangifera indica]|uniref:probable myosin-binding protein 5 n=1 Tax=Mangifera indica TaxID=29780 RepID=UPI001CF9FF73|nr:probable myosin-binding protein 5 [Mangifera indica]
MAKRSFKCFVEQEFGKFPYFVIYAALEWVLIIILFIDGFLAFAANEFAKFFELRLPCLFCTRLDHYLVHRNSDFYYNESICENHKKDASSLAYCHVHRKLSDVREMCDGCLLSFATGKVSDCDTYKSLVAILHKDVELLLDDEYEIQLTLPSSKKDELIREKSNFKCCSCCGEPLKVRYHSKPKNIALNSMAPAPTPRSPFITLRDDESRQFDLPHIQYTELKLVSDNGSEVPDDTSTLNRQLREEVKATTVPLLIDSEDFNEDRAIRGNKFFGIPLSDSSPNFSTRLQRKLPFEKTDDSKELTEGHGSNEAYGDSILQQFNRHLRLDHKSLMALYMELDEERSASAVAANNAMAMITRLQAEKAAVQMDALQYQRMTEEEAEYDQEALQRTRDLLSKREEEIKELEAELDAYRIRHGCLDKDYQESKSECSRSLDGFLEVSSFNDHSESLRDDNEGTTDENLQQS